ncbi:MAG: AMP-binding protein [Crocinitomicaceae bacterium]
MSYTAIYSKSIENPNLFWEEEAKKLPWFTLPKTILQHKGNDWNWFADGEMNTCFMALDHHVKEGRGNQNALIYDSPVTETVQKYTYAELTEKTSALAAELSDLGIQKGDTVVIYMPMIPEAVMAMLACARIGAIHSVVFGGFAPHELALRIDDAKPKAILTANFGIEISKKIHYLNLVQQALKESKHPVSHVVVKYRENDKTEDLEGALDMDTFIHSNKRIDCVSLKATDPLYILYTSGTTGKPKGILRENGGHAVALKFSMDVIYAAKPGEVYWAASDIGWVVGHSYIVYAPLIQGCTTILFEGKPVRTPDAGAFWRVIEEHKVNTLFTAPTAIRAIKKEDPEGELLKKNDISTLKNLFLAGERCDPATLHWASEKLNVPVVDHWWQTETGWPIVANPMGIDPKPIKAGSSGIPVCGFDVQILNDAGEELGANQEGFITVKLPLPPGCLSTLWEDRERFERSYLQDFNGYYKSGDGGFIDEDGYVFIMGRIDDVINVAGHRLSTGEMEEVIAGHPAIAECAVFGVDDDLKGQVPSGLVVLKDNVEITAEQLQIELVEKIRETIGHIACLKEVRIVKRLPKTRSGKIVRKILSAMHDHKDYLVPSTLDDVSVLGEIEDVYRKI